MTWTAQAHDRQGQWSISAPTYGQLRTRIIAECEAGHLWGPLYVSNTEGEEYSMTEFYRECYGLRTDDRPEPMIDEDEEAIE